jgi:endonuclease YncB( thermonuclease family)
VRGRMKYILAMLLCSSSVNAEFYDWKVDHVIDGDTVKFDVSFLPPPLPHSISVRLYGIDTPEKSPLGKCEKENELALKSTEFTKHAIEHGNSIIVDLKSWDKYGGRVLGDIIIDDVLLSQELVKHGLAKEYNGKTKQSWCD